MANLKEETTVDLFQLVREGNIDRLKRLSTTGQEFKVTDDNGRTLLHQAAACGHLQLFTYLAEDGLDPYAEDKVGNTVLHEACVNGHYDIVKFLCQRYPHMRKMCNLYGETTLHYACKSGGNKEIFQFLLDQGLDALSEDNNGLSVLHTACSSGNYDMVRYIVNTYPELRSKTSKAGLTVLHSSAECGSVEIFKFLLDQGLDEQKTTFAGETVLHLSCSLGRHDFVKYLVDNHPDLKGYLTKEGKRARDIAAAGDNAGIIALLTDKTETISMYQATKGSSSEVDTTKNIPEEINRRGRIPDDGRLVNRRMGYVCTDSGIGIPLPSSDDRVSSSVSHEDKEEEVNERPGILTTELLNTKTVQEYVQNEDIHLEERIRCLQWICSRVQKKLHIEHAWAGYRGKELVIVCITKKELSHKHGTFENMRLIFRRDCNVSNEARDASQTEMKESLTFTSEEQEQLLKCLSTKAETFMKKHSNLQIMSVSKVKSRKYGTNEASMHGQTCIVFNVHVKGIIPFQEEPFPTTLDGFEVDVREGRFYKCVNTTYYKAAVMGSQIATAYNTVGTLGAFVDLKDGRIGGLTCWHLFLTSESKEQLLQIHHFTPSDEPGLDTRVWQPNTSEQRFSFGKLSKAVLEPGNAELVGVDAALIELDDRERFPNNGRFPNATLDLAGFTSNDPMEFYSGSVYRDFKEVPMPCTVSKVGRTSGHTVGMLRSAGACVHERKYIYTGSALPTEMPTDKYMLCRQFEVLPIEGTMFSEAGDSGSLVLTVIPQDGKKNVRALGLLVGVTSYGSSIVSPIWAVLERLECPDRNLLSFPLPKADSSQGQDEHQKQRQLESRMGRVESDVASLKENVKSMAADISDIKDGTAKTNQKNDKLNIKLDALLQHFNVQTHDHHGN